MATSSPRRADARIVVSLLSLVLIARAATIGSPIFEHHSWRQAATAGIAKNFARDRLNPLYPQIEERGAALHGYLETCLELDAFLIGSLWRLVGISVPLGRLVNALLAVASAFLVWQFVRRRYDVETAHAALFIYAVGFPMLVWIDRAYLNEPPLLLLTLVSFRATQKYLEHPSTATLVVIVAATMLVAMVKPPHLIMWGPMVALLLEKDGARMFRRWEPYLVAACGALALVAWYSHAAALREMTGLYYPLRDKLFDRSLVLSSRFRSRLANTLTFDLIGPFSLALGCAGVWLSVARRGWFEVAGVLSFVVYIIVVAKGNYAHDYYQSALVPIWTVAAAHGAVELLRRLRARESSGPRLRVVVACLIAVAIAGFTVRRSIRSEWYRADARKAELCRALVPHLRPADLLLTVDDGAPDLLFCLDHRGWALAPDESTPSAIREAWTSGATVLVLPTRYPLQELEASMREGLAPLLVSPGFAAYRRSGDLE